MRTVYKATNTKQRNRKPEHRPRFAWIGAFSFRFVMMGLVIVMGLSYLVLSNHVATQGFQMKEYQGQIQELKVTNDQLEVEVMDLQSLSNLKSSIEELDLVGIQKMEYLSDLDQTFALGE